MRILVTGANGLLGQRILKYCLEKNIEVLACSKGESRLYNLPGIKYRALDITDKNELAELIESYKPNAIINTAALTHVDHCEDDKETAEKVNVTAVGYLADLCVKHDIYLCHVSTDFIFDGEKGIYEEDDEPNPVNFYGETKLRAEQLLSQKEALRCGVLRTILVYGFVPNLTRTNIILWLNDTLAKGNPVNIVTDQFRMPTYADDLALACLAACEKSVEGVFHVSGPEYISIYDLALLVAKVFGHNSELINPVQSEKFSDKAPRPPKTGFKLDKAREYLDYSPLSLENALNQVRLQIQDFKK